MRVVLIAALVSTTCAVVPRVAWAEWRCGSRLVGRGDAIAEVYARCGEPSCREASVDFVTYRIARDVAVTREVPIELWTYDLGPKQFVRFLTFRDGTLVRVDEGRYGH